MPRVNAFRQAVRGREVLQYLDQVVSETGPHRRRDFLRLEPERHVLELGHHLAASERPQIPAPLSARVVGEALRQRRERAALHDGRADAVGPLPGPFRLHGIGLERDQDVRQAKRFGTLADRIPVRGVERAHLGVGDLRLALHFLRNRPHDHELIADLGLVFLPKPGFGGVLLGQRLAELLVAAETLLERSDLLVDAVRHVLRRHGHAESGRLREDDFLLDQLVQHFLPKLRRVHGVRRTHAVTGGRLADLLVDFGGQDHGLVHDRRDPLGRERRRRRNRGDGDDERQERAGNPGT
jgi:hypothetical protein